MSSADHHNPFAPPVAHVVDVVDHADGPAGELAGRWARLGAALIDSLISGGLMYLVAKAFGFDWIGSSDSVLKLLPMYLIGFVLFGLAQGWLLHTRSQTIGKLALGIRIKRVDGSRAGLGRTLGMRIGVMWLIAMIPLIGPLISLVDSLLIFRASRRCLHDLIADTVVVKA